MNRENDKIDSSRKLERKNNRKGPCENKIKNKNIKRIERERSEDLRFLLRQFNKGINFWVKI